MSSSIAVLLLLGAAVLVVLVPFVAIAALVARIADGDAVAARSTTARASLDAAMRGGAP